MPRKRKDILALPESAKSDIKTAKGLIDKYAGKLEELGDEVFAWAKKHKFLIAISAIAVVVFRYWLAEQQGDSDDF